MPLPAESWKEAIAALGDVHKLLREAEKQPTRKGANEKIKEAKRVIGKCLKTTVEDYKPEEFARITAKKSPKK